MSFSDELDEKEALIEFNRQRKKTYSQLMNEADMIDDIVKARNKAKQLSTLKQGDTIPVSPMLDERQSRTDSVVADKIGMKQRNYTKVKKVWDTAKTGDIAKIGQTFNPQLYNIWSFAKKNISYPINPSMSDYPASLYDCLH